MKLAVCAVLLAAWCGAGCVTNIGGKVALIADYETAPGEPGGAFRLRADGNERHLLLPALVRYRTGNPSGAYDCRVPVSVSLELRKPEKSQGVYEAFSGLLTIFSLGIWPTIVTEEIRGTLRLKNETLVRTVPVVIKKRSMVGFLSFLPVPGWAEWRGKESDFAEGKILVLERAVAENLRLDDYRKCLIGEIVRGKDVLLDETARRQDLILRHYALRHGPERWRHIQRIRTESALAQRDIARLYADLRALGHDPWSKAEFAQACERWFTLAEQHRAVLIDLEKSYCTGEYGNAPASQRSSGEITLEELLRGTGKEKAR